MRIAPKPVVESKKAEPELETKRVVIETLSAASDGTFSGLAIPFDSLHDTSSWMLGDGWQDTVTKGAFTDTLAAHKAAGTMPLLQWMHQRGNIIGTITSAKETPDGVRVEGKVSPNAISPSGVPVLELLRTKAVSGLSIGFRPTQVSLDEKTKVRTIEGVDWSELSVVDIAGAGPEARVTDIKSDPRSFESELVSRMGLSRREAKALMADGYSAIARRPAAPAATGEELAATKVSRMAAADSDAANESSEAAGTAHGAATVAHAKAAADHVAAAHSNMLAAKQAADKGDAEACAEFKAAADIHGAKAGGHNSAAAAMQACYQMKAVDPAPPAPIHAKSDASEGVKSIVESIKDSLSQRDADGTRRDGASTAAAFRELAQKIQNLSE